MADKILQTMHFLKCWPEFFDAIAEGRKRHDLRRNDRKFAVGDILLLKEFDPATEVFTGRSQIVNITYITSGDSPCAYSNIGIEPGFCVLSIERPLQ